MPASNRIHNLETACDYYELSDSESVGMIHSVHEAKEYYAKPVGSPHTVAHKRLTSVHLLNYGLILCRA